MAAKPARKAIKKHVLGERAVLKKEGRLAHHKERQKKTKLAMKKG